MTTDVAALETLGDESRLGVFRTLVESGAGGRSIPAIADQLDIDPAMVALHIGPLVSAGLVAHSAATDSYVATLDGMTGLVGLLLERACKTPPSSAAVPRQALRANRQPERIRPQGDAADVGMGIERRVFQYRDLGTVTAFRLIGADRPLGMWRLSLRRAAKAIYLRAASGQAMVLSSAASLARMTDQDLVALCERATFRPAR